jgi:DNA-binding SARP family transcriptional activator
VDAKGAILSMDNVHISLFDKLSIRFNGQVALNLQPRRAAELFCYLLLYRNRLHEREKLATLLWPDSDPVQSRRYLRQTLWQLQVGLNTLDPSAIEPPFAHLLDVAHNRMGINSHNGYRLDVAVFEEAFAAVENKPGQELCCEQAERLRQAVQLYRGDLLEGWYQEWCVLERDRLQNMYLAMLDKLLGYSEAQHAYESGLAYGIEILRYDRAREQTHRQLMRLYYLAGNRTAALHQYELCTAALYEELGVEPATSTIKLYHQISNEQVDPSSPIPGSDPIPTSRAARQSVDMLQQLEQIQVALVTLQTQVAHLAQNLKRSSLTGS